MNSTRGPEAERLSKLAAKLAQCPAVTKDDTANESQAWTMAHAFTDLETSFQVFIDEQIPKLLEENLTPQEIHDLLLDIGEEFRHIIYHINDPQLYKRLLAPLQHDCPSDHKGRSDLAIITAAGVLDTARFRTFIAQELPVSVEYVTAVVLGGHSDTMASLVRLGNVSGIPLTELMDQATLDRLVDRTRNRGDEIVKYLKTGSAYYAPSARLRNGRIHPQG